MDILFFIGVVGGFVLTIAATRWRHHKACKVDRERLSKEFNEGIRRISKKFDEGVRRLREQEKKLTCKDERLRP